MEEVDRPSTRGRASSCRGPTKRGGSPMTRLGSCRATSADRTIVDDRRPTYEEVAALRPSFHQVVEFVDEEIMQDDLPGFYRATSADRTIVDDRRPTDMEVAASTEVKKNLRNLPKGVLKDTRQKIVPRVSLRYSTVNTNTLRVPLPAAPDGSQKSIKAKPVASSCCAPFWLCLAWLRRGACFAPPAPKDCRRHKDLDAPRKWYRIHPVTDLQYFVRPDAGKRGRIPGMKDPEPPTPKPVNSRGDKLVREDESSTLSMRSQAKDGRLGLTKSYSVPIFLDKRMGQTDPTISGADVFQNLCRICYEVPTQVISLPCRHGGMCEDCCRRTLLGRPAHKGGRACPFCRKAIREIIRIYEDAVIPQYGYALDML